ncbi:MAG: MFS transporter [Actinomycetota bacterium]|nr:MFS transporter [Actinomycetota bacterium]
MITEAAAPTTFRWDRLTASSALAYCLLVACLSVGIVLPELREQFHISGVIAALHGSTFGIGLIGMGIWGVRLIDAIGRRHAFELSFAAMVVGVTLFCVGPAWPITLFGTAISGSGAALLNMATPGVISDHHGEHRAAAFSAVNAIPAIAGVAFSLLVGAALRAGSSWRTPYLALTLAIAIAFFMVARTVQPPEGTREGTFSLRHLTNRTVTIQFLFMINATLAEFTVGIWGVSYLQEVGGASNGLAPMLATAFGIAMFVGRIKLPLVLRHLGSGAITAGFLLAGLGAATMCFAPWLSIKVVGLAVVGLGGGLLYPLTVDRFYETAGHVMDSVSLGAYAALASGVAVTIGPLALGVLADSVGLRWAILIAPVFALVGAITQRPRRSFITR